LVILKELIDATKITPVIDRTFPFSEVPDAIRYLESGQAQGEVVISVNPTRQASPFRRAPAEPSS
jgi:D-arabinose 1-dehydrogenase-like Zn-dependent alcohol dehydrogenase